MRLHLRRDPLERALQPDAAVEVVGHRGDDQDDQERRRTASSTMNCEERQLEDVEADVLVELRVLDAEVDAVGEQDPAAATATRRRRP